MEPSPLSPFVARCHKIRHPSRRVALAALRRVLAGLDGAGKDRESLKVYRCCHCKGGWHIGGTRERVAEADRRPPPACRAALKRELLALADDTDGA